MGPQPWGTPGHPEGGGPLGLILPFLDTVGGDAGHRVIILNRGSMPRKRMGKK